MNTDTYRFTIGRFECLAVYDGEHRYSADHYFHGAPPERVGKALRDYRLDAKEIPSPYSGLIVSTGSRQVLIDTGAGDFAPGLGRLVPNLRARDVAPEEIDVVILTHAHPDHIGGVTDQDGRPVFAKARHIVLRDEWDYWTSDASLAHPINGQFVQFARKNLLPLQQLVECIKGETEVVPGVRVIPAPGHTPGHMAVGVVSDGDELLYISDAALHPIHLDHPDWYPIYDLDPQRAIASRRVLFDRAAAERALVLAFHFPPFPSLGHVVGGGSEGGWRWEPIGVAEATRTANTLT